ncbi:MAG: hypothetical protein AB7U75_14560 [Hyphomicrobiaceae bacterium]
MFEKSQPLQFTMRFMISSKTLKSFVAYTDQAASEGDPSVDLFLGNLEATKFRPEHAEIKGIIDDCYAAFPHPQTSLSLGYEVESDDGISGVIVVYLFPGEAFARSGVKTPKQRAMN